MAPATREIASGRRAATRITSRDNRWVKTFRAALAGRSERAEAAGVEGPHLVEAAIRSRIVVEAVLVSPAGERHLSCIGRALDASVQVLRTTDSIFASVAATETPQGIAALVRPRAASFDDLLRSTAGEPLVVVLTGVQDPGNVGTVVRTAAALGASGVACTAGTAYPFSPKALRSSAGAAFMLPVLHGMASGILLAQLRVARVRTLAACPPTPDEGSGGDAALAPWQVDLRGPVALLIGNEGAGLPAEIVRSADARVTIPAAAGAESLNAAIAAAVLLYETARQRTMSRLR